MNLRKRISLTMPVPVYQILHHIVSIGTLTVWTKEDGAKAQNAMDLAGIAARRRTDMERYTKRLQNGVASWAYPNDCYGDDEVRNKVFKSVHRQNACEKLAAIEDILGDEYDLDRVKEAVKLIDKLERK